MDIDAVAGAATMRLLAAQVAVNTALKYRRDAMAWEAEFGKAEALFDEAVRETARDARALTPLRVDANIDWRRLHTSDTFELSMVP